MNDRLFGALFLAAAVVLSGCNQAFPSQETTSSVQEESTGGVAFRIGPDAVSIAAPVADSIKVRIIALSGPRTETVRSWPLSEGEILIGGLAPVSCSLHVALVNKAGVAQYGWSSKTTIVAARTTSVAVVLQSMTGSLSMDVTVGPVNTRLQRPKVSHNAGLYDESILVGLGHPVTATRIQYRLENAASGRTAPWALYADSIRISTPTTLFYRSINGTDTGEFFTNYYSIIPRAPGVVADFNTIYAYPLGWNGAVYANSPNTVSASLGGGAATIKYTINSLTPAPIVRADFRTVEQDLSWINHIQFAPLASPSVNLRLVILSDLPAYKSLLDAGAGYGYSMVAAGSAPPYALTRPQFTIPTWYSKTGAEPTLAQVLATSRGLSVQLDCIARACALGSGSFTISSSYMKWL